jgi:hypothetical protein
MLAILMFFTGVTEYFLTWMILPLVSAKAGR